MSLQETTSTSSQNPAPSGAAAPEGVAERPGGWPVTARMIIVAALVMYAAMMGLILYRWMTLKEPNALLRLHGTESDNGAVVEVSDQGMRPITYPPVTLGPENDYVASFPLPPGTYHVRVHRGSKVIGDGEVTLREATFREPDPPPVDLAIFHKLDAEAASRPASQGR